LKARDLFVGADGRPRWGWRLLLFVLACLASMVVLSAIAYAVYGDRMRRTDQQLLFSSWIVMLALLGGHALMLRLVERRGWGAVSMGRDALRPGALVVGALLGALAIGVPAALLLVTRWLRVEPAAPGSWGGAAMSLAVTLAPAALWEELAFRGYPFQVLRERFGAVTALGVTSVLFGLLHAQNPGAAPLPILIVVAAGFFLGAVLLATRSLYAAWAAHFAWNWTMSALFHMAVSGGGFPTPDYRVVEVGPDWLTGGAWGPEGGLAALLGMSAGVWYLWARPRRWTRVAASPGEPTLARPDGREES